MSKYDYAIEVLYKEINKEIDQMFLPRIDTGRKKELQSAISVLKKEEKDE